MKTKSAVLLSTLFALAGCATSASGLLARAPIGTFTSKSSAEHVAACIALDLNGDAPYVRDGDGHFVITRKNGYGRPVVRVDVLAAGDGSRTEVRRSIPINTGIDKIKKCM